MNQRTTPPTWSTRDSSYSRRANTTKPMEGIKADTIDLRRGQLSCPQDAFSYSFACITWYSASRDNICPYRILVIRISSRRTAHPLASDAVGCSGHREDRLHMQDPVNLQNDADSRFRWESLVRTTTADTRSCVQSLCLSCHPLPCTSTSCLYIARKPLGRWVTEMRASNPEMALGHIKIWRPNLSQIWPANTG